MTPLHFLLVCFAGWMNHRQQLVIEYLQEEIRVLKEQLGKRPHFNDDQRRRTWRPCLALPDSRESAQHCQHCHGCLGSTLTHQDRSHRSLDQDCPFCRPVEPPDQGDIVALPRLGGLHHRYTRQAA